MTLDEWLDIWLRDYLTGVKPSAAYLYQRQAKLKGLPPAIHRQQALSAA